MLVKMGQASEQPLTAWLTDSDRSGNDSDSTSIVRSNRDSESDRDSNNNCCATTLK